MVQRFDESIYSEQSPGSGLLPPGTSTATNALLVPYSVRERLRHFDPDIFDLTAESHITRFMSVLLGDAGAGQVRKQQVMRRMATMADGAHFLDLDAFYGSILGLGRLVGEDVPAVRNQNYTAAQWDDYHGRDGRYRSRVEQFARALNLGPTEQGVRAAVKVLLGDDAEVFESWRYIDNAADMATPIGKGDGDRREVVIRPTRDLSAYERRSVLRALRPLLPADVSVSVETTGIGGYVPGSVNGAWSPDDDYEIALKVTSGGVSAERTRPPLSAYQSDAWSLLHNRERVDASSSTSESFNFDRVSYPTGSTVDYLGEAALIRESEVRSGRLASQGIVLRHPYVDQRNEQRDPESVIYIDRQPLSQVQRSETVEGLARFWASKRRRQDDKTLEYLTTTFETPQRINHVSLEFSRFPCRVAVQVREDGEWSTVAATIHGTSFPEREEEPTVASDGTLRHPLHHGARHWRKMSESFRAREVDAVRVVLQRRDGTPPVDVSGFPMPYSLAVRRFDVGYRVRGREDFPAEPIATGDSLELGATVQNGDTYEFLAHQRRASNLVDDTSSIWKSSPQPVPDAVVPLYLDVRDGGTANVTSRIDLDPVTEGATINVYRALSAPVGRAPAANGNLASKVTASPDQNGDEPESVREGWRYNANNGHSLPLAALGVGNDTPYWVALQYRPDKASTAWGGDYILDIGGLKVRLLADSLRIESNTFGFERYVDVPAQGVSTLVLYHDPSTRTLWVRHRSPNHTQSFEITLPAADAPTGDTLAVGNFPGNVLGLGLFTYDEHPRDTGKAEAFETAPLDFLVPPSPWERREDCTDNAALRFHPALRDLDPSDLGFSGGPSIPYEDIEWTAVPGSYRLKRGSLVMPPALTAFLKMEFSDLSPEPLAGFYPTARQYRTFPQSIVERGLNIGATRDYRLDDGGQRTLSALARDRFDDRDRVLRLSMREILDNDRRPITEAMVANDHDAQHRLREASWLFGFTKWQTDRRTASMGDGQHVYSIRTAVNDFGVGYTVGLRHISVHDDDYTAANDTRIYTEHFQTADRWTLDGDLTHEAGSLTQTTGLWGEAISEVWNSTSPIEGVQFAALTSPPRELLDDFDFDDTYLFDDQNEWHVTGDAQAFSIPGGIRVDRRIYATNFALEGLPYGDDGSTPGVDDDMEDYTYGELEDRSAQQGAEGGIESGLAFLNSAGTLRGVVRITGVADTEDNPILVQIVREQDDVVVAQTGVVAVTGQTVEADIEYSIEQGADFVQYTYGDHEIGTWGDLETSTYQQLEVYSLQVSLTEGFRLRIVQELAPAGIWVVGKASLFEDTVRWEFSNDGGATWTLAGGVANNPDGVVSFKDPDNQLVVRFTSLGVGAGVSSLQIRPMYATRRTEDPMLRAATDGPVEAPREIAWPIREDPMFKMWSEPVPREWYLTS